MHIEISHCTDRFAGSSLLGFPLRILRWVLLKRCSYALIKQSPSSPPWVTHKSTFAWDSQHEQQQCLEGRVFVCYILIFYFKAFCNFKFSSYILNNMLVFNFLLKSYQYLSLNRTFSFVGLHIPKYLPYFGKYFCVNCTIFLYILHFLLFVFLSKSIHYFPPSPFLSSLAWKSCTAFPVCPGSRKGPGLSLLCPHITSTLLPSLA